MIGEEGMEETCGEGDGCVRREGPEDGVLKNPVGLWADDGVTGGLKVAGDCVIGELCLKITKQCLPVFVQTRERDGHERGWRDR